MDINVRVGNAQIQNFRDAEIVCGKDPKASNSFEEPNKIVSKAFREATINNGVATLKLPPLSVVAATFDLA